MRLKHEKEFYLTDEADVVVSRVSPSHPISSFIAFGPWWA
jgi:hypothetical protein